MTNVDELILESQRLRDELKRTAIRLDVFSEQLIDAVARMGDGEYGDGPGDSGTGEGGT